MLVRDVMTPAVLTVGPAHTVRQVALQMAARRVGAAVVHDPDSEGPGILTERDVLEAVAAGQDLDRELAMVAGGFRHLVICEGPQVVGVLSVRDVVRVWSAERAAART